MKKSTLSLSLAIAALVLGGCSSSPDGPSGTATSSAAQGRSASQICDGILGKSGGSAVEQITRSKGFSDSDEDETLKVQPIARAAGQLEQEAIPARNGKRVYLCLFRSTDKSTSGTFQISTRWIRMKPSEYETSSSESRTVFPLSKNGKPGQLPYASASDAGVWLGLRCPVGPGKQGDVVLSVNTLTSRLDSYRNSDKPELLTRISHSAARKLAEQMGCASNIASPEKLEHLLPLSVKS
ncbi:hypothetical protein ACWGDS_37420 [Streptomyces sp. NPDC055059]|uniref:hypothetical protein n=1 Tax=Streptomyces sp. NPDC127172 TaxID=3345382 RepID=UPI0036357F0A